MTHLLGVIPKLGQFFSIGCGARLDDIFLMQLVALSLLRNRLTREKDICLEIEQQQSREEFLIPRRQTVQICFPQTYPHPLLARRGQKNSSLDCCCSISKHISF